MNQHHLSVAVEAAKAGAKELMSRRHDRVVREKGPKDLVTDADLASQQAIRGVEKAFLDHAQQQRAERYLEPKAE